MNNLLVVYGKNHIEIKHIRRTLGITRISNGSGAYFYNGFGWASTQATVTTLKRIHDVVLIPIQNLSEIVLLLKLGMTEQDVVDFLNTKPLR